MKTITYIIIIRYLSIQSSIISFLFFGKVWKLASASKNPINQLIQFFLIIFFHVLITFFTSSINTRRLLYKDPCVSLHLFRFSYLLSYIQSCMRFFLLILTYAHIKKNRAYSLNYIMTFAFNAVSIPLNLRSLLLFPLLLK